MVGQVPCPEWMQVLSAYRRSFRHAGGLLDRASIEVRSRLEAAGLPYAASAGRGSPASRAAGTCPPMLLADVVTVFRRLTDGGADGDGHDKVIALSRCSTRPNHPARNMWDAPGTVNWLSRMPITASAPQAGAWSCSRAIRRAVGTMPEVADIAVSTSSRIS